MLEHLFERERPDAMTVTMFKAEPRGNYNRIMLSPVLAGEKTYEDIVTHDADWYARHGVTLPLWRDGRRPSIARREGGDLAGRRNSRTTGW